jgi:hypothetical protein
MAATTCSDPRPEYLRAAKKTKFFTDNVAGVSKHICDQNAFQAKYFETEHKHYRRYHVVLSALLYDRKYNMSTYVSKPTFNIILDL